MSRRATSNAGRYGAPIFGGHMLAVGRPIAFSADEDAVILTRNCAPLEDTFMWSTGRWCELTFDLQVSDLAHRAKMVQITLDLDVFKFPPLLNGQNVVAFVNGLRVVAKFIDRRTLFTFTVRLASLLPARNVLVLDLPDAARPIAFGLADDRLLGAQLFSLSIDEAEPTSLARPRPNALSA